MLTEHGSRREEAGAGRLTGGGLRASPGANVGSGERFLSALGGGALISWGLGRRSLAGLAAALLGGGLLYRGVSGSCPVYRLLGTSTAERPPREGAIYPSGSRWSVRRPAVVRQPVERRVSDDIVDEASMESFPASDPPSFTAGHS